MSAFSKLRQQRKDIKSKIEKYADTEKRSFDDGPSTYYPERNKEGTASVVLRLLPTPEEDGAGIPFVKIFSHGFKGPQGKWFIDTCPTTYKEDCPVCKLNSDYLDANGGDWKTASKEVQDLIRLRKRKIKFYSNVVIVKDPANPELEGTVHLFQYGQKIFNMISGKLKPDFEDEEPIDVFDLDEGCNFNFKIVNKDGYANYDKSSFDVAPSALANGDEAEMERIFNQCKPLQPLIQKKSFEDLNKRLNFVMGTKTDTPEQKAPVAKEAVAASTASAGPAIDTSSSESNLPETEAAASGEDDELFSYFDQLAND